MNNTPHPEFGKCLTTKNVVEKKGRIKWCIREEGSRDVDNGWRFFSEFDTEEYLAETSNWSVVDFDSIVEIDPILLSLMWMPYGTELTIEYGDEEISYNDDHTGVPIVDPLGGKPMLIKRNRDQSFGTTEPGGRGTRGTVLLVDKLPHLLTQVREWYIMPRRARNKSGSGIYHSKQGDVSRA